MIGWKDYPNPNLRFIRNIWVLEVIIPTSILHLFGNESGANNNKRKATGTIDKALAERRVTELTHKMYEEFDDKQLDYVNHNEKQTDRFAENKINSLAKALKYNKGLVPLLEPSTEYTELVKIKARFANAFEQVKDDKAAVEIGNASMKAKNFSPTAATLLNKHFQLIVQSYWQDLLTSAVLEQGVTPSVFEKLPQEEYLLN